MASLYKKVSTHIYRDIKDVYQKYLMTKNNKRQILFIIGSQRSGTTLMTNIFERDINAKVYGEFSALSSLDKGNIRLNPLDQVETELKRNRAPFIILKPLVETQNTLYLLEYFHNSKAVWMFRDYKDVASSYLKHWGTNNGIRNLRPLVNGEENNWRSENRSDSLKMTVKKLFSEDMPPFDAAALFWYVRNTLFFDLNLMDNPDVMMCRYEDLVISPSEIVKTVYSFCNIPYPGDNIVSDVHAKSISKGKTIHLSPEIDKLCSELLDRLLVVYHCQEDKK